MASKKTPITPPIPYFYDGQIRRYIKQFIRVFAGLQFQIRSDADGNSVLQTVPVRYGDISRMSAHILKENSENTLNSTPFLSCYIIGFDLNPEFRTYPQFQDKLQVYEKKYDENTGEYLDEIGNQYTIERHAPVPYKITMQVDIWTSNTEQKLEIIEQALTWFNPSVNIHTNDNPLDWSTLSNVQLLTTAWNLTGVPSGVDDQIDNFSLTYEFPILINPPAKVSKNTVIHSIISNINNSRYVDLQGGDNFDPIDSFRIVTLGQYKMKFDINLSGRATAQLLNQDNNPEPWVESLKSFGEFRNDFSRIILKTNDNPNDDPNDVVGTISLDINDPTILNVDLDENTISADTIMAVDETIVPKDVDLINISIDGRRYLLLDDADTHYKWPKELMLSRDEKIDELLLTVADQDDLPENEISETLDDKLSGLSDSQKIKLNAYSRKIAIDSGIITNIIELNDIPSAKKYDIIEYNGTEWIIPFINIDNEIEQYTTIKETKDKLKWINGRWVKAIEATYDPGFWQLYL